MYYFIDAIIKEQDSIDVALLENNLKPIFLKDIKDAFLKNNHEMAKEYLILFLTWEGYFSFDFQNMLVDSLYKESKKFFNSK
jgi:hypothetical protein